jgi:hypothetical protein
LKAKCGLRTSTVRVFFYYKFHIDFQAKKFEGTEFEEMVRTTRSAQDAKKLGTDRRLPFRQDWDQVKETFMHNCCYAKFTQHDECKKTLLGTGDSKLVEHTAYVY